ncbi:ABC-type branched-subunit amino acid transport system ATPase component/ABC-type branched-subunit amino acid transport system permease subunit [Bradyrhizobium sp. USDA 4510]
MSATDNMIPAPAVRSKPLIIRHLPYFIGAAVLVALAAGMRFDGYILNILLQATTFSIAVFGLSVVLGLCGQINLAQAAFFGFGAYVVGLGTADLHLNFWLCLVGACAITLIAGAFLGMSTLRLGGHYLAMVTISFQQIVTLVMINAIGVTHGPDGVANIRRPELFQSSQSYLAFCVAMLAIVGYLVWHLPDTKLGRAMRAVRDNELAAGVNGIDVFRTKIYAFGLCALLGGLAGGLFAGGFAYVSPDQFSFAESIVFLTMSLLGGVASPIGSVIGTGLLILIPEWLRFLKSVPGLYLAIYGLFVILIIRFMPDGIWGFVSDAFTRWRAHTKAPPAAAALQLKPATSGGDIVLEVTGLSKHFGGLKAVDGVDIAVKRGSVHALIGPNGSGKTTTLNVLSGLYKATAGRIVLDGTDITNMAPHQRTAAGLGRTFQNIRLFRSMTALENVEIGAERPGNTMIGKGEDALTERAMEALTFVGLGNRANELISSFSYGHQRLIEIARALASNPTLLLLDEPAAGLNSTEKLELHELLKRIAAQGLTILIIDHDMTLVSGSGPAHHRAELRTPHRGRRVDGGAAPSRRRLRLSRERMMPLLEIRNLVVRYGEIEALRGVTIAVEQGQVVTLLGANGAGKSTTLRAISGLAKPASGDIMFDGHSIAGLGPEAIVRLGISHVPEGRRVFPGLTVKENIMLGASNRKVPASQISREADAMFDLFPDIRAFSNALGWTLSGGQLQMVAVARGLMAKPRLLLLDEPSLGLAPVIVQAVFRIISQIRKDTTVLLVEQNARMGLSVADHGFVLETGRIVLGGKPDELWGNEAIAAAYLGGHAKTHA